MQKTEEYNLAVKIIKNGKLNSGTLERVGFVMMPKLRLYQQNDKYKDALTDMSEKTLNFEGKTIKVVGFEKGYLGSNIIRTYTIEGIGYNIIDKFAEAFETIIFKNKSEYQIEGKTIVPYSNSTNSIQNQSSNNNTYQTQETLPSSINNIVSNAESPKLDCIVFKANELHKMELKSIGREQNLTRSPNQYFSCNVNNRTVESDSNTDSKYNSEAKDESSDKDGKENTTAETEFSVNLDYDSNRKAFYSTQEQPKSTNNYDLYENNKDKGTNKLTIQKQSEEDVGFI